MTGELPRPARRSWWLEEALEHDPGEPSPMLSRDTSADVVILGGGYTGMWTAYFLKERDPGVDVVILEQDICGGGPSGRNGGFVNAWWGYVDEIVELFGEERGLALCRAAERSVKDVGEFCERHDVDAWFALGGDVGIATSPAQRGRWQGTVGAARRYGVPDRAVALTPEKVGGHCRSPVFDGGMLYPDQATVQPARLARGLRRVLLEKGVRIHERTPLLRFARGRTTVSETPSGAVRAGRAVIALNAWAASWKAFRSRLAVRGSYIVATTPAPEKLADIGWTSDVALWNFRAAVNYLRTTPDGRIVFGTGGMQPGLARATGRGFDYDRRHVATVVAQLHRMFPSFRDVPLEAAWGGPIDVSGSHLPYFGTLAPGNVHFGHGYTGNGVGPCLLGGRILSGLVLGIDDEFTRLPLVGHRPRRFPPEPLKSIGSYVANEAILRKDAAEDADLKPNALVEAVAKLPRRLGYNLGP